MISTVESGPLGMDLVTQVEEIFSPTGILSKSRNFEYRPEQQQMAVAVARALQEQKHLLVEAGTGVGKSLGYLIPSILFAVSRKKKAIISTHTINLQEQLMGKDLPMLAEILPVPFKFTMLKGRQNYLCTRRLRKAMQQMDSLFTSSEAQELHRIYEWSQKTEDGSLSDFETEPDPKVWQQVCSERGLCAPKLCGHQSDFAKEGYTCFFQRARSRIMSADVLVMNHTLFFMHLSGLEDEPKGGILFKNDFLIFDEAHTVEPVASKHIGSSVSSAQVRYSIQRLYNPATEKGLLTLLKQGPSVKMAAEVLKEAQLFFAKVEEVCEEMTKSSPDTRDAGQRARLWSELRVRRPDLVRDTLSLPIQRLREAVSDLIKMCEDQENGQELLECNRRLAELRDAVTIFLRHDSDDFVYWVSRGGKTQRNLALNVAPLDVADFLRQRLFGSETSVVMTSATLSTDCRIPKAKTSEGTSRASSESAKTGRSGLGYFASRIGGESATQLQVGSPFDYERQMKVFVIGKMPDPREAGYQDALIHWVEHFIRQSHGKAFVLFTNFKLMQEVGERMEPFFEELKLDCFIQGTGTPRTLMLEKFKEDINSVLFGTDSFWQGVDVPGEALSNVIITRLPFAVPDHPLIEARIENIEARGGNSFAEFSLPEAILKFRQGVGRLIRTKTDSGIVVILDNRVLTKRYGQAFLDATPKCPIEII